MDNESKDNRPDQTKNEASVAIDNIFSTNWLEADLWVEQMDSID